MSQALSWVLEGNKVLSALLLSRQHELLLLAALQLAAAPLSSLLSTGAGFSSG